ncbi:sigma-70 family RNA polymerase sigma factor [Lentzea sp. BCCO 10_0061]|uniref:Sigma-70 family RNA polymerase sigma factor n=1 Tax=Lentzea sokolovensis TaxID=3095429 RepID=A0ABU4V800_9PSEU|nr:sigma-70 family RNA polymerase sigma factor [Lentzea sp. BCCO 10_0061]MDX8147921.1 sigma-70 family RNA polymerase sigma factor [Lentzea sp. BCCO 10_0061]
MQDRDALQARETPESRRTRVTELFGAVREGRHERLDELVAELSPLLWQVARGQGLDRPTSQDVVQTTWLNFLRDIDNIREPGAVVGWLITTTKREAWRARRKMHIGEPLDGYDVADDSTSPEENALLSDRQRRLWEAVARLPRRCQELLRVVAFVQRPDYTAVSRALGMARGSVGPTRGRCLAQLRSVLDADPGGRWL